MAWHLLYVPFLKFFVPTARDVGSPLMGIVGAFVSALILVAAHICPSTPANLSDPLSERTWERCIAILRHHHEQMPSSKRAVALLEALKAQVCVACDSTTTDPSHQRKPLFLEIV